MATLRRLRGQPALSSRRWRELGLCWASAALACLVGGWPSSFAPARRLGRGGRPLRIIGRPAVLRDPERGLSVQNVIMNEDIRSREVRLIAELDASGEMTQVNEVMRTDDALKRAESQGYDLLLDRDDSDPPLAKIVRAQHYVYLLQRSAKEKARKARVPKMKEVKFTYTTGANDVATKVRQMERWFQNPKQQVQVRVALKGRARMFEQQARDLLFKLQKDVCHFASVAGGDSENPLIRKDGRGDLMMQFKRGADKRLVKLAKEEAPAEAKQVEPLVDEDDDDDEEEDDALEGVDPELRQEIKELQAEMEEVKQDLLDCGIAPSKLTQQPEYSELLREMGKLRQKAGL